METERRHGRDTAEEMSEKREVGSDPGGVGRARGCGGAGARGQEGEEEEEERSGLSK